MNLKWSKFVFCDAVPQCILMAIQFWERIEVWEMWRNIEVLTIIEYWLLYTCSGYYILYIVIQVLFILAICYLFEWFCFLSMMQAWSLPDHAILKNLFIVHQINYKAASREQLLNCAKNNQAFYLAFNCNLNFKLAVIKLASAS